MNKNGSDANDNDDWDFHRPLNVLDVFKTLSKRPNNAQTETEDMKNDGPIQRR